MSINAQIVRAQKKEFTCRTSTGEELIAHAPRKIFRYEQIVTGDLVVLEKDRDGEVYSIVKLQERKNEIFRLSIREKKKRVTAANCDHMLIITSADCPSYKRGVLDRLLVRAAQWNIPASVVFNKMDLFGDLFDFNFEIDRLNSIGVDVYAVSSVDDNVDSFYGGKTLAELKRLLHGKLTILLGQSGVGKSKLITRLSDGQVELLSGDVAKKTDKGSHTTAWSEIISCGNFNLIDSPGVRSLSIDDIDAEELINLFPDLLQISLQCKFRDCEHLDSSKGCAFAELDEISDRECQIIYSRLESFLKLKYELGRLNHWERG